MKIICKTAESADCPARLQICCGICPDADTCPDKCSCSEDHLNCPDAEVVTDELAPFQSAVPDTIQKITALVQMKKQMDEQEKLLKAELVKAMEAYSIKSFENEYIKMVYVAPTTRSTIDSTRLKKDHPDLVEQYTKTSNVSASVRVTVK